MKSITEIDVIESIKIYEKALLKAMNSSDIIKGFEILKSKMD